MPELSEGETAEVQGSARLPYILKNVGGVYSCSCPAWRNQSLSIERRTCKHLTKYRGIQAEQDRIGKHSVPTPLPESSAKTVPPLLLAHTWSTDHDPTGWLLSEKLDGVRAYWDGTRFYSRLGNVFHAPDCFVEHLPDLPLDGELWIDRKAFQRTISIVRRQDKSDLWNSVKFLVFDAPANKSPFEERIDFVQATLRKAASPFAVAHLHQKCQNVEHLQQELARIEALGGEGVMLREPGSLYEAGRSHTLLKVKTFHDGEALVIGHQPGTGRHRGRLGALLVQLKSGVQFAVGTGFSDTQRNHPPAIGSTITFRYQELTDCGVPRFPSFVRIYLPTCSTRRSRK